MDFWKAFRSEVILLYVYINYRIRTNIGEELNLENWQIFTRLPNLNLVNIFLYHFTYDPSCFWWHLLGLTNNSFHK